jgi:sugar lactone lactonase YvrE
MRRLVVLVAALATVSAPAALAHGTPGWHGKHRHALPEKIALPEGFAPEGIEIPFGTTFLVGSTQTGAIYAGDLRTGAGRVVIPGGAPGTSAATGLEYDRGRLWVSGAGTGTARVYDLRSGELIREYQLGTPPATFINDAVVTRDAVYFTDSQQPSISRIALGTHGEPGALTTIPLTGDYQHVAGQLNLNGIVATRDGKRLIAVSTGGKALYAIDAATGVAKRIDVGGYDLVNGDGLLLWGKTLFVVQNRSNRIAVFRLSHDLASATFVKAIADPDFDVPTTIDRAGRQLWAVNARFGTATPADQHYDVVKVG